MCLGSFFWVEEGRKGNLCFFFFFFCAFFCSLLFVFEVQTTDAAMEMLRMGFLVVLSERLLLLLVLEVTKGREAGREGKVLLLV